MPTSVTGTSTVDPCAGVIPVVGCSSTNPRSARCLGKSECSHLSVLLLPLSSQLPSPTTALERQGITRHQLPAPVDALHLPSLSFICLLLFPSLVVEPHWREAYVPRDFLQHRTFDSFFVLTQPPCAVFFYSPNSIMSQQSPLAHQPQHYGGPARPSMPPNNAMQTPQGGKTAAQYLAGTNEQVWLQLGTLSEVMGELDGATQAYERAMNFNQWSVPAMLAISCILRSKDQFTSAVEYLRQILKVEPTNGEVWSSLGHCYLMMDDLQQAYSAYQQALYHLPDPKEPKLWYGIGILYDRYGSLEHAEEAFSQVMRMEPNFEKANEIYFRLGIIYKQQQKFAQSLEVISVSVHPCVQAVC